MLRTLLAACLVVAAAASSNARADTPDKVNEADKTAARDLYREGKLKYKQAKLSEALERFTKAYELWPQPVMLFNIAQTYRLLEDCREARLTYRKYLIEMPDAPNRTLVEKWLADMETCIDRREKAAAQKLEKERIEAEAARARAEAAKPFDVRVRNPIGLWVAAAGGAVLAGGAIVGVMAIDRRSTRDDTQTACTSGPNPQGRACWRTQQDDYDTYRRATWIAVGSGVAVASVGLALWLIGKNERRSPAPLQVAVSADGIFLGGRF